MLYLRSMQTKFVFFGLVSISLVLAAYSSSMSLIFAISTDCEYYEGKTKATCVNIDEDSDVTTWACEKLKDGNWTCVQVKQASFGPDTPISPELSGAIGKAQGGVKPDASIGEGANDEPKVPKEPAFDNGLTTSPGAQNETEVPNGPAFNDGLTTSP